MFAFVGINEVYSQEKPKMTEEEVREMVAEIVQDRIDYTYEYERLEYDEDSGEWDIWIADAETEEDAPDTVSLDIHDERELLVSYEHPSPDREDEFHYIKRTDAREIAEDFLDDVAPEVQDEVELMPGETEVTGSVSTYDGRRYHEFEFRETAHGYKTPNHIRLEVDPLTGTVTEYTNNYDLEEYRDKYKDVKEPEELQDQEQIKETFINHTPQIKYVEKQESTFVPVFIPTFGEDYYLGTEKDQVIDKPNNEQMTVEEFDDKIQNTEYEPDPDEYPEPEERSEPLTEESARDKADKVMEKSQDQANYQSTEYREGWAGIYHAEHYSVEYMMEDKPFMVRVSLDKYKDQVLEVTLIHTGTTGNGFSDSTLSLDEDTVDINTDELEELLSELEEYKLSDDPQDSEEQYQLTEKVVDKYLEIFAPGFVGHVDTREDPYVREDQGDKVYEYRLDLTMYNVPVEELQLNIGFCVDTGSLYTFTLDALSDTEQFEDPQKQELTEQEQEVQQNAMESYLQDSELTKMYRGDYLVYEVENPEVEGVFAGTEEYLEDSQSVTTQNMPQDIQDHPQEGMLEYLYKLEVLETDENYNLDPHEKLTRLEALNMIYSLVYDMDISFDIDDADPELDDVSQDELNNFYRSVIFVIDQNIVSREMTRDIEEDNRLYPDESVTREELAELAVKAKGLTDLAEIDETIEYKDTIQDVDEISQNRENHVALTLGMEALSLDDGEFSPNEEATREDVAEMFEGLLKD